SARRDAGRGRVRERARAARHLRAAAHRTAPGPRRGREGTRGRRGRPWTCDLLLCYRFHSRHWAACYGKKSMASRHPRRVRGSASGRPIMVLLDLLGRRMTLRILWELREDRSLTFRALEKHAGTNPSVLNLRLKELRAARLVEHGSGGYALSAMGRQLLLTLMPLN